MTEKYYKLRYEMSVKACAESFIKTMVVHLERYPESTIEDMNLIYFIMYTWALDSDGDNRNVRNQWLEHIHIYMRGIDSIHNDAINSFIDTYFDSNVYIVTKYEMKDWLIPSMSPLPDLFSTLVDPDIESK